MSNNKLNKDTALVGFIGLGLMGSRLAERLQSAGWKLTAWNRSAEPAEALVRKGIGFEPSLARLCAESDVLLSCLANDDAVESVYLGDDGVLSSARPGTIVVEMSTISAGLSRKLHRVAAEGGIRLLDVAISGSTPAVEAGTITLLAGGDADTFEQCAPLYESIAKQWFLIGRGGSGVQMKLVVNLLLGVGMEAIAEAIALGERLDIDRTTLLNVLSKSAVVAPAFLGKFAKIANADFSPQFPLRLMSKDMNLVAEAATELGAEMPAASATQKLFASQAAEHGDLDLSAIAALIAGRDLTAVG